MLLLSPHCINITQRFTNDDYFNDLAKLHYHSKLLTTNINPSKKIKLLTFLFQIILIVNKDATRVDNY